jgi:hypothetical protein
VVCSNSHAGTSIPFVNSSRGRVASCEESSAEIQGRGFRDFCRGLTTSLVP